MSVWKKIFVILVLVVTSVGLAAVIIRYPELWPERLKSLAQLLAKAYGATNQEEGQDVAFFVAWLISLFLILLAFLSVRRTVKSKSG